MVAIFLILLMSIISYIRIAETGVCNSSYKCSHVKYHLSKYYGKCGLFNWSRCSRYRTSSTTDYRTCYNSFCCSGYTGSFCSQDINECQTGTDNCQQNCINTHGSFTCSCESGYTLNSDGATCTDINECLVSNGGCSHICRNSLGSYQCNCRNGFYLASDGKTCVDIDECLYNNDGCSEYCRNVDGFYECYCQTGLYLGSDGKICIDIDECSSNIGGCEQVCENYHAGFRCECHHGFSIATDGNSCQDVDECLQSNKCTQSCNNTIGSYVCSCHPGYQLEMDGFTCTDINECLLSNDTCDDECINTNGSFYCKCISNSRSLSEDGLSCIAHAKDKSYKSIAIGLGTGISLAFLVVAVLFVVLKTRRKKPSIQNETKSMSDRYESTQIEPSMNEYESVVVKEVVKVDDKTGGQISSYDNIQIKGRSEHNGQQRPDRETAEYENLVIFRK